MHNRYVNNPPGGGGRKDASTGQAFVLVSLEFYQGRSLVALAPTSLLQLNGRASGLATRRSQVRLLMVSGQRSAMMMAASFEAGQFSVIYCLFCMFKQVSCSCKNSCCSKRYLKNITLLNTDLCVCVLMNIKAVIE